MSSATTQRSPRMLYAHILKEMLRLIGLTAAVLTTVLAFAISIKPLADGLLRPDQCLKIIALSLLPAFYYALPFSACFGATLAYYRMAGDNELTAAHAGGVSHRSLLVPAALVGLVMAVGLWFLANWQIPIFLRNAAQIVSRNVTQFIETKIRQGEPIPFQIDGKQAYIYADMVRAMPASGSGENAYDRLWLKGILFVTLDERQGVQESAQRVLSEGTASEAVIWIAREPSTGPDGKPSVEIVLKPVNYVARPAGGRLQGDEAVQIFRMPNAFRDDPKFMTFNELIRTRITPELLPQVNERRRSLAIALVRGEIVQRSRELLETSGSVTFADARGERYALHARDLRKAPSGEGWYRIIPRKGEQIVVEQFAPSTDPGLTPRITRRYAREGELQVERTSDPLSGRESVAVNLRLRSVTTDLGSLGSDVPAATAASNPRNNSGGDGDGGNGGGVGQTKEWPIRDLFPIDDRSQTMMSLGSHELRRVARENISALSNKGPLAAERAAPIVGALNELEERSNNLYREILSKHHERLAMSFACLVMVFTGAVMAMRLRDRLPLTIYLWAFFPALLAVLTISTGQQLTHSKGWFMLPVLWAGVFALAYYTRSQFRKLARH